MKQSFTYLFFIVVSFTYAQHTVKGTITNEVDHDGINVFNKTYSKYTITDTNGDFEIPARLHDTIVFSALQYELKEMVVTEAILREHQFLVLKTKINELDAVYIMPKLSGNLLSDTKNIRTKKIITSKTIGLPNAEVVPPTPAERKVYTATHSSGGIIPVDLIINAITGRTKKLKQLVKWEKKSVLEDKVYVNFEEVIHEEFKIPKAQVYDFIFYSSQDELFGQIIKSNSSMVIYDFLKEKARRYLKLQNQK